ncbi:MAG: ribose 5-phosphate isomerase B [Gemmatimonadota bacterium]
MATTRRRVITERDVCIAARDGTGRLDARGAAVTPSAMDAARRLSVILEGAPTGGPPDGRTAGRSVSRAPSPLGTVSAAAAGTAPADPRQPARKIVIGADHGGVALKDGILKALREGGHEVGDVGTYGTEPVDYPDYAMAVARAVAAGRADFGIMIDGAGIGSSMVCNKIAGVRAALCHDLTTATNAREHNNANVLTLGGTLIGGRLAIEIVTAFIATAFGGGRHAGRVAKIDALDAERL